MLHPLVLLRTIHGTKEFNKIDPIPRQGNISFVTLIVPIIANIVSLNPAQARCTRYNIMW